jgi:hypothetical protein
MVATANSTFLTPYLHRPSLQGGMRPGCTGAWARALRTTPPKVPRGTGGTHWWIARARVSHTALCRKMFPPKQGQVFSRFASHSDGCVGGLHLSNVVVPLKRVRESESGRIKSESLHHWNSSQKRRRALAQTSLAAMRTAPDGGDSAAVSPASLL